MVLYELPSGKSIFISIERLLSLTKQDIQDLEASHSGFTSNDPFQKLPKSSKEFQRYLDEDNDEEDDYDVTPDILSDGDDDPYTDIDIYNIPDEN